MKLFDLLGMSARGLTTNKMRSALTMLGVIIGVASVIALVSVGLGARKNVVENRRSESQDSRSRNGPSPSSVGRPGYV